jgi:lia operon protein LiaI
MKKLLLLVLAFIAVMILIVNLGPMILLGVSIWLLYVIFKKFMKSDSTGAKIGWAIAGLVILCIATSNIFSIIGIAAAIGLYLIFKNWNGDDHDTAGQVIDDQDPFTNFERQWSELNN